MTYACTITARLLDTNGTSFVHGGAMTGAFDVSFLDEYNDLGTGSISMSLSDAQAVDLTPRRFVQISSNGTPVFTFKIEGDPEYKQISKEEEDGQVVTVSGRGWGCIFDEAVIHPEAALDLPLDTSWRAFTFASKVFNNTGSWANAVQLYEYYGGEIYGQRYQTVINDVGVAKDYTAPIGFPWPLSIHNADTTLYDEGAGPPTWGMTGYSPTYWIWTQQGTSTEEYGIGWGFFRKQFTIATPMVVTFACTADNFFTVFLEGIPILGEDADHYIWLGWKEIPISLPAGTYQVGIMVENTSHGLAGEGVNQNSAGLLFTAHTMDGQQQADAALLVSDNTWLSEFSADIWPGWTSGQILVRLLYEADLQDGIQAMAGYTFSGALDSFAAAWGSVDPLVLSNYIPAFSVEVGSTVYAALKKLEIEGWIYWHVKPNTLTLDVYAGVTADAAFASGVELEVGVNLGSLERSQSEPYANYLLTQWAHGYVIVKAVSGPYIQDIFSTDAATPEEAESLGRVELARRSEAAWAAIIAIVEPTSAADAPYEGFFPGEFVTIPTTTAGTQDVRVLSIAMRQDAQGYAEWTTNLNRRIRVMERRQSELLRQIGGRSQIISGTVN